jgi:hypothetical protein
MIERTYNHAKLFRWRMGCPATMDESYTKTAIAKSFDAGTQFETVWPTVLNETAAMRQVLAPLLTKTAVDKIQK